MESIAHRKRCCDPSYQERTARAENTTNTTHRETYRAEDTARLGGTPHGTLPYPRRGARGAARTPLPVLLPMQPPKGRCTHISVEKSYLREAFRCTKRSHIGARGAARTPWPMLLPMQPEPHIRRGGPASGPLTSQRNGYVWVLYCNYHNVIIL